MPGSNGGGVQMHRPGMGGGGVRHVLGGNGHGIYHGAKKHSNLRDHGMKHRAHPHADVDNWRGNFPKHTYHYF